MTLHGTWRVALLAVGIVAAGAARVGAQGTGRSLDIDTSIRAAGMGGANSAVFWGEPSLWGNPAATAFVQGVRYEYGRTQLVPGLADDIFITSRRVLLGAGGLGVSMMGRPSKDIGGTKLDYGESVATDPSGNPIGVFDSYEKIEAYGAGLAFARAFDGLSALSGHPTSISRFGEFAAGLQKKHLEMLLGPGEAGHTDAFDWGWQLRASPLQLAPEPLRKRVGIDVAWGRSVLNSNGTWVDFPTLGNTPTSRIRRHGVAVFGHVHGPWEDHREPGLGGLLRSGFAPLVALGWAQDHEHVTLADAQEAGGYDVDRDGVELTVLGVATYRTGHVTDLVGDIDGDTSGWGLAIPLGDIAIVRYDHATIPQARNSGLQDVERHGWSGSFDPIALWKYAHAR